MVSDQKFYKWIVAFFISLSVVGCGKTLPIGQSDGSSSGPDSSLNPLYPYSWHLQNTGQSSFATSGGTAGMDINFASLDLTAVNGSGVKVAISDNGIEVDHPDLVDNYDSVGSKDFTGTSPYDGDPNEESRSAVSSHGTAVAGIIAAVADNSIGGLGVAPSAQFGGFNYLNTTVTPSADLFQAQMTGPFDVFNFSYGLVPCLYYPVGTRTEFELYKTAYQSGVSSLRSGKGANYIKAAGNEADSLFSYNPVCGFLQSFYPGWQDHYYGNANFMQDNTFHEAIVVGAIDANGVKASYSNPGANLWVTAPGGEYGVASPAIVTTDLTNCGSGMSRTSASTNDFENGDATLNSQCDYTSAMNGSSAATPVVAGVVALMLDANPDLTWRDVKHILAMTAQNTDTRTGVINHPDGLDLAGHTYADRWVTNDAGYSFHNYYGFGVVDAAAAVAMASTYAAGSWAAQEETINPNTNKWYYDSRDLSLAIPNNSSTGATDTLNVLHALTIEAVQIKLSVSHAYAENLGIELTSPSGTTSKIANINSGRLDFDFEDVIFLSNAFYGENSLGTWSLKLVDGSDVNPDGSSGTSGTLTNWQINIIGRTDPTLAGAAPDPIPLLIMNDEVLLTRSNMFNWTASPSSDVIRYEYSVGTTAGGTDVHDWASMGNVTNYQVRGLNLDNGGTYYFNIRAVDETEKDSTVVESIGWVAGTPIDYSVGYQHSLAINNLGGTKSWGDNAFGQLGDASFVDSLTPTDWTLANAIKVYVGEEHSCAIDNLGNAYCFGQNSSGQLGDGTTTVRNAPVPAISGTQFQRLGLGDDHTCGVTSGNQIMCWGASPNGELGGGDTSSQLSGALVDSEEDFSMVSANQENTCALTLEGRALCWGSDSFSQIGNGSATGDVLSPQYVSTNERFTQISVGQLHTCAVSDQQKLFCWGMNTLGELGDTTTTNRDLPVPVDAATDYSMVASGDNHTCAVTTDDRLKCWGRNDFGQWGDGTFSVGGSTPTEIFGAGTYEMIKTYENTTCAMTSAGVLDCFGANGQGQVGDGGTANQNTPQTININ